jgi:hypothetical protein
MASARRAKAAPDRPSGYAARRLSASRQNPGQGPGIWRPRECPSTTNGWAALCGRDGKDVRTVTDLDWAVRDVATDEDIPVPDEFMEDESDPDEDEEGGEPGGEAQ